MNISYVFDVQKQTITLKLHKKNIVLLFGFNFEPKLMSFLEKKLLMFHL